MSANALRHVIRRREHRERAQPAVRAARFGLLEKHKDYKLRAIDYHRKQDTLKVLKEKAAFRNEDEYYMNMHNAKTKNGVHVLDRKSTLTPQTVKIMKAQDFNYLQSQQNSDLKRIEKLKQNMHFLMDEDEEAEEEKEEEDEDDFDDDDDDDDEPARKKTKTSATSSIRSKHVIFVDDAAKLKSFTPANHFQTAPELVGRTYNRLRQDQLAAPVILNNTQDQVLAHRQAAASKSASTPTSSAVAKAAANKSTSVQHALQAKADQSLLAGYSELAARLQRKRKLSEAVAKLQLEKNLAGKGARKRILPKEEGKFGEIDEKKVVYKWKMERKK